MGSTLFLHLIPFLSLFIIGAIGNLDKLDWIKGTWRAEYGGSTRWPTIPTMGYGEEIVIKDAPQAKTSHARMLEYSARSWSPTGGDHLHDEWGFMTVDYYGKAYLMTSGNNESKVFEGFNKFETGTVYPNYLRLELEDIFRIDHIRDLPVRMLIRTFEYDGWKLNQILEMRTRDHPRGNYSTLEHARISYEKIA